MTSGQIAGSRITLAGRYTIERELGTGGMGTVFQAFDAERCERVALKTLRRSDAASIYRFKREFHSLADVSHGNLVQLYELVAERDLWFFTMELIVGRDFVRHVRPGFERVFPSSGTTGGESSQGGPSGALERQPGAAASIGNLDPVRLRDALRQLIDGVEALHAAAIVHCDLKPANVLVTDEGRVVILDFGVAAEIARSPALQTIEDGLLGTIDYMSPEQCAGELATPASDWYSVGALLYEALTGRRPFTGSGIRVLLRKLDRDPPPPTALAPGLPPDLVAVCRQLMARSPRDRPGDEELRGHLRSSGSAAIVDQRGRQPEGMPLVGRTAHLGQLADALAEAERNRPVSVCVVGPSGIGKTTLVRHFTDDLAARRRAVVLSGRCFVRETVPYKALDGVIDMLSRLLRAMPGHAVDPVLPRDVSALAHVFPVLRRVVAIERLASVAPQIPDPRELRRRAFAALSEMLRTLGKQRPVVVHIDDLQWADRDSADVLNDLLQV
ncbi:MAG: serine/threonine-protein kinase, partial [Gemmatimonadales bacterium]